MAQSVHLWLTANGTKIDGDSTILSLDREDTIECLSFVDSVRTAREASSGMATGERTYEPIRIAKRIDKSSPLLAKALCNNEVIEATFKFYRPDPAGSGTQEHFYTIEIEEARVASVTRVSRWTYEPDGIEHIDHWSQRT